MRGLDVAMNMAKKPGGCPWTCVLHTACQSYHIYSLVRRMKSVDNGVGVVGCDTDICQLKIAIYKRARERRT